VYTLPVIELSAAANPLQSLLLLDFMVIQKTVFHCKFSKRKFKAEALHH